MSKESTPPVETNPDDDQENIEIVEEELDEVETLKSQLAEIAAELEERNECVRSTYRRGIKYARRIMEKD